jgi:hypothetical protein
MVGFCALNFDLAVLTPTQNDLITWEQLPPPDGMTSEDWDTAWPTLSGGHTRWRDLHLTLTETATRLSRRGEDSSSALGLLRFTVGEALGRPSSAALGQVRDPSGIPIVGATVVASRSGSVRSSTVTDVDGKFALACLEPGAPYTLAMVDHRIDTINNVAAVGVTLPDEDDLLNLQVVASVDLNQTIDFTIYFENDPEAQACVREVHIRDLLDTTILDVRTFTLRDVQIGIDPTQRRALDLIGREQASGVTEERGSERLEATTSIPIETLEEDRETLAHLTVDVNCGLDLGNDQIDWHLTLRDQLPVEEVFLGFLPPNKEDWLGQGEGHVSFTIKAHPSIVTPTLLENTAFIVFDNNDPIETRTSFRIITVVDPEEPSIPSPLHGATDITPEGLDRLRWSSEHAESFDVSLWLRGENPEPIGSGIQEESLVVSDPLLPNTTYDWQVTARGQDIAEDVEGPIWSFTTSAPPGQGCPVAPDPLPVEPTLGAVDVSQTPRLSWSAPPQAALYQVFIWPANELPPQHSAIGGLVGTAIDLQQPLALRQQYNWKVGAYNATCSIESPVWSFRVREGGGNVPGDWDGNPLPEINDAICLLTRIILGPRGCGALLPCEQDEPQASAFEAPGNTLVNDADGSGNVNLNEAIHLLTFILLGGPPHTLTSMGQCVPISGCPERCSP